MMKSSEQISNVHLSLSLSVSPRSAYCSSMKSSSAAVQPRLQKKKKRADTFTCKKGAIKTTHPHKRSVPSMEKDHA